MILVKISKNEHKFFFLVLIVPESSAVWIVLRGDTLFGREVDVFKVFPGKDSSNHNLTPSYEKPEYVFDEFVNYRWKRYFMAIEGVRNKKCFGIVFFHSTKIKIF